MTAVDMKGRLGDPAAVDASLSNLARGVVGSEILRIAAEIRALKAKGASICNLTVGDFDPTYFPVPEMLLDGVRAALAAGHTNYPPSDGVLALREAVTHFYGRGLGLSYPVESVLITGGARPLLYGAYRTVLDPGDVVVYPVPSWNNNHYAYLCTTKPIELPVSAETNFFPTAKMLRPHLSAARLLMINSPLNPTGTVIDPEELRAICELVVEENRRRAKAGADAGKALWLCYDQVYWQLTFGAARHATPPEVCMDVAPYTIMLDAASKSFAATGMRVGWAVMPPAARQRMADILGHVGAWAPKAEQVALAALLEDEVAVRTYHAGMLERVKQRLDALAAGFQKMRADGFPVEVIDPQGAIYLSVRVAVPGRSNDEIRQHLLSHAGFAVVPFQAFGLRGDSGWFRISVGAVSERDIEEALPRVRAALAILSKPSAR
ncbi:MAG TPA: aminotransferase class I/II-fold pyridoxal phosphate-dependent enzyme [Polyangia bacterium]|jgi:aspartate aminotransferase|nr:aminotransferase class I/II-fold pyridoxal phosphate-dependent enzyme [Polyangia bacterium]